MRTTAHHRPARRAHEDDAALDYAYDAGQRAYQNEVLQERLHEAQRRLAPGDSPPAERRINGRRVRAAGQIDDDGMYYIFPRSRLSSIGPMVLVCVVVFLAWVFLPMLLATPRTAIDPPLGTAEVVPTRRPAAPPRQDSPVTSQDGSTGAQAPEEPPTPPPTSDYGVASYNATQQAIAVEQAAPEATPLPEPGEPTFVDSFQPAQCSAMITYLRGHPCFGRVNQAPQPQPGDDDFAASFKEPTP